MRNVVVGAKVYRYWENFSDLIDCDDPKELYQRETRLDKLERYFRKKASRVWKKKVKYFSRQKVANGRQRVNGKFISTSAPAQENINTININNNVSAKNNKNKKTISKSNNNYKI